MRHAELRIFALADGNRVVKAAPETAVSQLGLVRRRWREGGKRENGRLSVGIKKSFLMRTVVDKKGLVMTALAKMHAQQGENTIFGLDLCGQYAAGVGKTHKAPILLQLSV